MNTEGKKREFKDFEKMKIENILDILMIVEEERWRREDVTGLPEREIME